MTLLPRHALIAAMVLVAACGAPSTEAAAPARRTPAVFPTASPSPSESPEESAPSPVVDPSSGEQLAMRGSATMTVLIGGTSTQETLTQSADSETVIEQSEGETVRVLRLAVADPKRADDVQFTIDGVAAPGTFKTGEADLRVVFYDAPLGVDLLSDQGNCTVVFDRVDAAGAAGSVTCADIPTPAGNANLTASFKAEATDAP